MSCKKLINHNRLFFSYSTVLLVNFLRLTAYDSLKIRLDKITVVNNLTKDERTKILNMHTYANDEQSNEL